MNICEIACLECKKTKKKSSFASWAFFPAEPSFAECWRGTRQSDQTFAECQHSAKNFSKKNAECLTRQHSAKNFSKKNFLCRVPDTSALGKGWRQVDGARYLCRVLVWHSANPLPSACHVALGKDSFADHFFAEWALPRAALGKVFADGKGSFAEWGRHSAKVADLVVIYGGSAC